MRLRGIVYCKCENLWEGITYQHVLAHTHGGTHEASSVLCTGINVGRLAIKIHCFKLQKLLILINYKEKLLTSVERREHISGQ